jgi:lipopolysaccharide/colanic/teichoic acid biosynthesis glycosyltransferase
MASQGTITEVLSDRTVVLPFMTKEAAQILANQKLRGIGDVKPVLADVLPLHAVHHSVSSKVKRLIDIVGASAGLIITAIIFIPIAVAISLDSPGPILYSQIRCGLQGIPFRIWKFRTMGSDADLQKHLVENEAEGNFFKNKNDPRITRIGKFLRSTSLDEFPQFWNVLRGEMSLVGTRPPTPDEVANYQGFHFQRLLVRPGITGEWQVRGRSSIKSFDDIVRLDIDYQNKWSPLYDLRLILKTITVVFAKDGAY